MGQQQHGKQPYSKEQLLHHYSETHKNEALPRPVSWGYEGRGEPNRIKLSLQALGHRGVIRMDAMSQQNSKKVVNPAEFPHRCIGYLSLKFPSGIYGGTGCLIGRGAILTAAHNVYHKKGNQLVQQAVFLPGLMGNLGRAFYLKKIFYFPKRYITEPAPQDDVFNFAVLEAQEEALGIDFGFFGINTTFPFGHFQNVSLFAYSSQKIDSLKSFQRGGPLSDLKIDDGRMQYQIRSYDTQCGGPIVVQSEGRWQVVGIHVRAYGPLGLGVHFDERVRKTINSWVYQVSGQLNLWDRGIDAQQIDILTSFPWANMTILRLGKNRLGNVGIQVLTRRDWPFLRELYLRENQINALVWNPQTLPALEQLYLTSNLIRTIDSLDLLLSLELLDLSGNQIEDMRPVAGLRRIVTIYLGYNKIDQIAGFANLDQLRELWLQYNQIHDIPEQIIKLTKLEVLKLHDNPIDPKRNQPVIDLLKSSTALELILQERPQDE